MEEIFEGLNSRQQEAVRATEGRIRVVAGILDHGHGKRLFIAVRIERRAFAGPDDQALPAGVRLERDRDPLDRHHRDLGRHFAGQRIPRRRACRQ